MRTVRIYGITMRTVRIYGITMRTVRIYGITMRTVRIYGITMRTVRIYGITMRTVRIYGIAVRIDLEGTTIRTQCASECMLCHGSVEWSTDRPVEEVVLAALAELREVHQEVDVVLRAKADRKADNANARRERH
jgi:hypothetical protein